MKAIFYTKYGPPNVLQLKEVEKPVPNDNEVLVKVQAASANALDFRRFEKTSILGRFVDVTLLKATNTVLGADIAGRVEAVGAAVKQFQPGDENARAKTKQARKSALEVIRRGEACVDASLANPALPYIMRLISFTDGSHGPRASPLLMGSVHPACTAA